MKTIVLSIFLLIQSSLFAVIYTTSSDGDWTDASTWDANGSPGSYWGAADQVIINHDVILNQNVGYAGSLEITAGNSLSSTNRNIALNNGASLTSVGNLTVNNLTLNSTSNGTISGTLVVDNNLVVGNGSTLICSNVTEVGNKFTNNGGNVTFNDETTIDGNLENNNGTITFNSNSTINGNVTNNNASAVLNFNADTEITGFIKLNSSSTLNMASGVEANVGGNFTANSGSTFYNEGRINVDGNFTNNGGTIQNDGITDIAGNFTQNGGTFTNDGVMVVEGNFRVNGGGTVNGSGLLRTNNITNYGTISGSNDICGLDDSTNPSTTGGGAVSGSTTYCTESASAALPIDLAFFNAEKHLGYVHFSWKTYSEINNDYFQIEWSENGATFKVLKQIKGAGNSNYPLNYEWSTSEQEVSNGYFRLKQVDFDGKYSYSKTVSINSSASSIKNGTFSLYPNPLVGQKLKVDVNDFEVATYKAEVVDLKGQVLSAKIFTVSEKNVRRTYEVEHLILPKGVYFVRIQGDHFYEMQRLIVD